MSNPFSQFESRSPRLSAEERRKRFWVIAGLIAATVGVLYAEYHISHHRTLHVVNGYLQPVAVRLETGESVTVPPQSFSTLALSEGAHQATIVGGDGREDRVTDFTIESNWWARLIKDPVFVLNIDGAAVVVWEKTVYRKEVLKDDPEQESAIHIGKPFVAVDDVDYVFMEFPDELKVKGSKAVKSRVALEKYAPADVLFGAPEEVTADDRMAFVEAHLRMSPSDTDLMQKYAVYAEISDRSARSLKFFQEGLDRRPVQVHWHRAYQFLQTEAGREAELVAEYRKRVESDPKNSNWLYLLGRVESDPKIAEALFERSIEADQKNPFPWYAKSHGLRARGRFAEAVQASGVACRLDPTDDAMQEAHFISRLGAQEAAALEGEVERRWNANLEEVDVPSKLLEVLSIQGNKAKMDQIFDQYRQRVFRTASVTDKARAISLGELELNFLQARYDQVLQTAAGLADDDEKAIWSFFSQLAKGSLDEAAAILKSVPGTYEPHASLALSIALRRKQDVKQADELQKEVVETWEEGDSDDKRLAALVRRIPNVTPADVEYLSTSEPYQAALLLTALAQQCPKDRGALLDEAEKRNFRPWPYQEMMRGAIADARKRKN